MSLKGSTPNKAHTTCHLPLPSEAEHAPNAVSWVQIDMYDAHSTMIVPEATDSSDLSSNRSQIIQGALTRFWSK